MAKNEIVNVITIKTEESQQTIKGLKKEIADLKKSLDTAVIGSDEFEKASKELAMAQAELKTVMADGKKTTDNMEGSYNHLVATMAELKKQWKATADEVKRNELGKEIDAINNQLKELDGTIGNNQRLVGSYAEEFKKALGEQDDATIRTRTQLESVQKVTAGLANGYAAVQGAMTLLNIENENLQKAMVKVQSAMAIAQGVGGMKDLVEGLSRGKVAFKGALAGCKAFIVGLSGIQKAIIATGIGALVVAIGLLIANWDKLSAALGINKKKQEESNEVTKQAIELENQRKDTVNNSVGKVIAKYKALQKQWGELKTVQEKNEWIAKNATEFKNLGIQVSSVNDAQNAFINNSDKVIKALKDQARARALSVAYEEALTKQYKAQEKYNDEQKNAEKKYPEGYQPNKKERNNAGLKDNDFLTVTVENSWWDQNVNGKPRLQAKPTSAVDWSGANKLRKEFLKPFKTDLEAINGEVAKLEQAYLDAEETARQSVAAAQAAGTTITDTTTKGGETDAEKKAKELAETQKKIKEELRRSELTEEQKLLDDLDKKYQEYMVAFQGNTEMQLKIFQWYTDEHSKLVDKQLDKEIEAQKKAAEEAKKIEDKKYADLVAASEKRLDKKLQGYDDAAETAIYLNERRKPEGNGEINAIDNELSKLETLKNITNEQLNLKVAAIEAEQALFEKSSQRWLELENQKVLLREQTNRTLLELEDQLKQQTETKQRALAGSITKTFTAAMQSASAIIGALQEGIDTTTKEGFERNKKMQIAQATIQMLVGITSALAGAYTTKSGPWDWILAGIQAATIGATGAIQIANIKKQTFDGGGSGSVSASVSPSMGFADVPVSYTRNLMGDKETENLNQEQRVYILESDIEESGRRVEVRDSNTNF